MKKNRYSGSMEKKSSSTRSSFYAGLIAGGLVAAVAAYFLLARPAARPTEFGGSTAPMSPANTAATAATSVDFSPASLSGVERISPDGLKDFMDRGEAVLIDVRDIDSFKAGHIPGALQIPLQYVAGETQYFPRDKKLITYCT